MPARQMVGGRIRGPTSQVRENERNEIGFGIGGAAVIECTALCRLKSRSSDPRFSAESAVTIW